MPSFKKLFPSKYLKAADLDGQPLTLTIAELVSEWIGQGNDAEEKPVLKFRDRDQGLVLNVTNANMIAEHHGEDYDQWKGKSITLVPTRVQFGSQMVDAIRLREPGGEIHEPKAVPVDDTGNEIDNSEIPF